MILHSVEVENWRCFLGKSALGPFSDRVNILYAPNATGKSTLFEALRFALMDKHDAMGEDARKLRTWGRELSPRVKVEFSVGGSRYRVTKKFLDKPSSLLERYEDGEFRALAEGPKADDETRKLFTRNAPKRGMSRPEHWGVLQVLWAPQGRLELGELSGDLLADIRQSLSAQVIDDRTRGVEKRLLDRYARFFTPTGKKRDSGASASIEKTACELETAKCELAEVESVSKNVNVLSKKGAALQEEIAALRSECAAIDEKAAEFEKLNVELEKRKSEVKMAESEYARLKAEIDRITEIRKERDAAQHRLSELDGRIPDLEAGLEAARERLDLATRALDAARNERREADDCLRQSGDARRFVDLRKQLAAFAERIAAIGAIEKSLSKHERERTTGVFPDPTEMKRIRKACSDLEKAKIRLDSSLITLEIVPAVSCSGRVEAGTATGPAKFEAGKAVRLQGAPEVRVDVDSFGSIRAFGPCDSAEEARDQVGKAEQHLEKLTARFGKTGKSDIEELFEEGASLDRHIERERAERNGLLGNDTREDLAARRDAFNRESEEILARFPEWGREVPDATERVKRAAERKALADEALRKAEAERDGANNSYSEKNAALLLTHEQKKNEEKILLGAREGLGRLESDGRSLDQLQNCLNTVLLSCDLAKAAVEKCLKEKAEYDGNPVKRLEKLRETLREKEEGHKTTNEDLIRANAILDRLSQRGLYSAVAALEERLAALVKKNGREDLESESVRFLHDTYSQCRSELSGKVTLKATEMASGVYSRIVGASSGNLVLAESLKPSGFIPEGTGVTVDVDSLSGGEKEQLNFAVRLALATSLANDERHLLVLDDAFMATDPFRFQRILEIIDDAAARLQILILTCHPDRFAALSDAMRFDLEGMRGQMVAVSGD